MRIQELTTDSDLAHVRTFALSDGHTSCNITVEHLEDHGFPLDPGPYYLPVTVKQGNREVATALALIATALISHPGHTLSSTS